MAISPVKIVEKRDTQLVKAQSSQRHSFIFAIILGLLGALFNSFPIDVAANVSFIIGNSAFIIAASYLRPTLTLFCALLCTAPLLITLEQPFVFITVGLEAIFVSYFRGRGWYLPTADFLYWLILGMPLTALIIWLTNNDAQGYLLFSVFKQCINAIFYTTVGVIIVFACRNKLKPWVKSQQPPLVKNLKQYLHFIFWILSAFFIVGVCLFLSRSLNNIQEQQFTDKLEISGQYLSRIAENYVNDHKNTVAQLANNLSIIGPSGYDDAISKVHTLYPGFSTMLVANQDADVVSTSPHTLMTKLPKNTFNVADRAYFSQAFFQQQLYTSPAFLGRGFGVDPIVAISAPIYGQSHEQPIGIVEGSLNLNLFAQIHPYVVEDREISAVLTDENDNVIYADAKLGLTTLAKFSFSFEQEKTAKKLMVIGRYNASKTRYLYRQIVLNNGWKVFVLIEQAQILQLIERQYLTIFMSLSLIFIFVVILAHQFSNTLNRPLAFALNELAHGDVTEGYKPIPYDAPTEFLTLYQQLQQAKEKLLKQQFILADKVEKRTRELNKANKALKELANKDRLTGLYNRRYLETKFCELQAILSRNDANMMVAMLDLDHFKKLNDEYGHLMGDSCLEYVGALMQRKFDRRSDIVARFGGEEFVIVTQHDEQGGVLQKLEELREELSLHCFPYDTHDYIGVTISIGVVTAGAKFSDNIDDWIRLADEQLYQAKDKGRNNVSVNHLTRDDTPQEII
ncbi:MAG: sensor domain-containing diguanylate cyclase [Cognaticolwellia sp.]